MRTIDTLLEELAGAEGGASLYFLSQLLFTTESWLRNWSTDPRMDRSCRDPVLSLSLFTANELSKTFGCTVQNLSSRLERIYGVNMSKHGVDTDRKENTKAKYHNAARREVYKTFFIYGRACHYRKGAKCFKILDDQRDNQIAQIMLDETRMGFGYVLSMRNELYIADFSTCSLYHSQFMAGEPVQCAGSILIKNGIVTEISNNSGHYKPVDQSLVKLLLYLRMNGVNLAGVNVVKEVGGGPTVRGDQFLQANGNWKAISARAKHQPKLNI